MMKLPGYRLSNGLLFLACVALLASAWFMEYGLGLVPCHLCILQRFAVALIALPALAALIHHPQALRPRRLYGLASLLAAVMGAALAGWQLHLQSLPREAVPTCLPDLGYLLEIAPLTEVVAMVLAGDGNCAEVAWRFLGLSIPGWTLIGFIGLGAIASFQALRR